MAGGILCFVPEVLKKEGQKSFDVAHISFSFFPDRTALQRHYRGRHGHLRARKISASIQVVELHRGYTAPCSRRTPCRSGCSKPSGYRGFISYPRTFLYRSLIKTMDCSRWTELA